jgi:hypothetical protein
MLPARVTGDAGAFQRSSQEEIGSTRSASRFIAGHLRFGIGNRDNSASRHAHASAEMEV